MYKGYAEDSLDIVPISATDQIPVIDVGPLFENASLDVQVEIAKNIRTACENIGFFYVKVIRTKK